MANRGGVTIDARQERKELSLCEVLCIVCEPVVLFRGLLLPVSF